VFEQLLNQLLVVVGPEFEAGHRLLNHVGDVLHVQVEERPQLLEVLVLHTALEFAVVLILLLLFRKVVEVVIQDVPDLEQYFLGVDFLLVALAHT